AADALAADREQQSELTSRLDDRARALARSVQKLGAADSDRALPPGYVRRQLRESVFPLALLALTTALVGSLDHRGAMLAWELAPGAFGSVLMASTRAYLVRNLLRFGVRTHAVVAELAALALHARTGGSATGASTAEQSAAVAEISATVLELATAAAAIAESSRGVAVAADETSATML